MRVLADHLFERDGDDVGRMERDHLSCSPSSSSSTACAPNRVASTRSKLVGEPPRCRWPSTTVRVSLPVSCSSAGRHARARRRRGARRRPTRLPSMSEIVPSFGLAPFGDDDDAEVRAPGVALLDRLRDHVDVVRDLRDQDDVGAAADARVERDPARVAPHHLDDHDAVVRLGGRVEPVDRVGRERHGGVEPEAVGRADDVVVDRLRDADDRNAALVEVVRDGRACRRRR